MLPRHLPGHGGGWGESVILLSDSTTVITYPKREGGTVSKALCDLAQEIVLWTELHSVILSERYIAGRKNVLVDQLSRPDCFVPR